MTNKDNVNKKKNETSLSPSFKKEGNQDLKSEKLLSGETMISDIVTQFPDVVEFLIKEYDFYCMNCFLSDFETLEEGAMAHGIVDVDFEHMLEQVNEIAHENLNKES